MGEYITMTLSDDEGEDDYYNKEISMGAVSRLKIDPAPGPDIIFSKLLINADITVLDFLLQIFIKSWNEGYLPKQWKKANVKFLKKPGKPNYNNPSYQPISLTSIIGKLMERIITSHLEGFVETNDILDEEQEGF